MITDGFTYVAVLLFMAGALVTLEKTARGTLAKFFKYVPSMVLCYLAAMLLCTLGVWDLGQTKAVYGALKNNLTYAMICYGADGLCGGHAAGHAVRQHHEAALNIDAREAWI